MIYLLAILLFLILVAWLDRIARAQEAAALTLIQIYAALMNRENHCDHFSRPFNRALSTGNSLMRERLNR